MARSLPGSLYVRNPEIPRMEITHDEQNRRFVATDGGVTAELNYVPFDTAIDLVHTVVPKELQGEGVGSALVRAAFDYAATHHLGVKTSCPFAARWAESHPDARARVER